MGEAWRLEVGPGESNAPQVTGTVRTRGSTVRAINLFDTIPARKQFLKRDGSEAVLCRQVFIEKALAFPALEFRFIRDGKPQDFLPAVSSQKERFAAALLDTAEAAFLPEIHVSGEGFSADIVIGRPELFRYDRRMLYVFANGRRIQEYSLMQAMEYGVQGWFPNGTHPAGAVFINIDPALVDFNIHPAKREVRFRDSGAIHHAVSSSLRNFFNYHSLKNGQEVNASALGNEGGRFSFDAASAKNYDYCPPMDLDKIRKIFNETSSALLHYDSQGAKALASAKAVAEAVPVYSTNEIRFAGRVFGLFILAEWNDRLFIVDQHAAHERILYNRFISEPIPRQELLVPIIFTAESTENDRFLNTKKEELAALALEINRDGNAWRIDSLPSGWNLSDAETVNAILDLCNAGENIAARWVATICCHQAVRDGDYLDDATALALAREALALPDPRCPHGRPVLTEISREALFKAVRRI
jgi:DNA mismatch repair protein MutL